MHVTRNSLGGTAPLVACSSNLILTISFQCYIKVFTTLHTTIYISQTSLVHVKKRGWPNPHELQLIEPSLYSFRHFWRLLFHTPLIQSALSSEV
jgi:hypothetical protein